MKIQIVDDISNMLSKAPTGTEPVGWVMVAHSLETYLTGVVSLVGALAMFLVSGRTWKMPGKMVN